NIDNVTIPEDLKQVALFLINHPNIASKRWVYTQYDSMVGTVNRSTNTCTDAAIVNLKDSKKALALTVDCNSRYVFANPETGCAIAVAEAARNITCSGGQPSAITNCLNFGNPYDPEAYWQFVHAIKGMGKACLKFNTPVTGGNVSFYNQSEVENHTVPVFPTPTIGMLGILADKNRTMTYNFKQAGHHIYLLGSSQNCISSSQYLAHFHQIKFSPAPYFSLDEEYDLHQLIKQLINADLIQSAHDCSEGGLWVALAESGFNNQLGFNIITDADIRKDAFLFGEAQGRVVVSISPEQFDLFIETVVASGIDFSHLGDVTTGEIKIDGNYWTSIVDLQNQYDTAIEKALL
ncbi:MAG TPA: AIR synthase related protein, partial [Bacteroidia bacterium]|nr:AIR synthase related protein [Bacteroidia bacterium]